MSPARPAPSVSLARGRVEPPGAGERAGGGGRGVARWHRGRRCPSRRARGRPRRLGAATRRPCRGRSATIFSRSRAYSVVPDERRRRPRRRVEDLRLREDRRALRRQPREREVAVLVHDDRLVAGLHQARAAEAAMLPGGLAGLDVERRQKRRPEVAGRAVDEVADPDRAEEHEPHAIREPELLRLCVVCPPARNLNRAAAGLDTPTRRTACRPGPRAASCS